MSRAPGDGGLVFLTGATGFIGGRLAAALRDRGYRLRCLVRSESRAGRLEALDAELVYGDTADVDVLVRGMEGAALAYHVAGMYDIGLVDTAAMERANVGGTAAFVEAMRRTGLPRGVYVSSTVALGPVPRGEGDERSRWNGPYPSHYHRTKTTAHHRALDAQADGLPLIIACPAYVYGPGDEGPAGHFVEDLLRHRLPALPTKPTTFSYVYVDDVVDGLIAAGEIGRVGATYVLAGEPATTNEFARQTVALAGTWVSPLRVPPVLVRATGALMDGIRRVTGWRLPISREAAATAADGSRWVHSFRLAGEELGYAPRPLAAGLPPTVRAAQEQLRGG
ncbi:MAG TPA: NAD-dependent epimerase/dehydratase family protein [Longimicrobiales bacterium]|nr:NAD-dependent epimerase/dehydratase family protein [Longimicrobiales bacterium]